MADEIIEDSFAKKTVTVVQSGNDSIADAAIQKQIEQYEANKAKDIGFDWLRLYYGEPYWVNDNIVITQPTIQDFLNEEFAERGIYATSTPFTTNPTSYRVQLWDAGQNWNDIEDYDLFAALINGIDIKYSSLMFNRTMNPSEQEQYIKDNNIKDVEKINWKSKELWKPIDFSTFQMYSKHVLDEEGNEIEEHTLYSKESDLEIDKNLYEKMANYIRYMFNSFPEVEHCKGKTLARQLVQNERLKQAKAAQEVTSSNMQLLISFALNHPGFKYKKNELREVGLVEFMDSVQRLQIYESTRALFGGMYSGFCDTSKINKDEFNFMRDFRNKQNND